MNHRLQGALIGGAIVAVGLFLSSLSLQQPSASSSPRGVTKIRLSMTAVTHYLPKVLLDAGAVPGTSIERTLDQFLPKSMYGASKGSNLRVVGAQWVDDTGMDSSRRESPGWQVLLAEDVE
jgi:hypothetical protein